MTKVTHPVLIKLSTIKNRLVKNPIVRGLGNTLIALVNLSREFYIANDTLHQDRSVRNRHPMRHI